MNGMAREQNEIIRSLREQWDALQLDLLVPAKLTDRDFAAILAARENSADPIFRRRLPMIVARFKRAAREEIMRRAREERKLYTSYPNPDVGEYSREAEKLAQRYQADIRKINRVLFNAPVTNEVEMEFGLYREKRFEELHADEYDCREKHEAKLIYSGRIEALEMWAVKGWKQVAASKKIKRLFDEARFTGSIFARRELRDLKILAPVPANAVTLMLGVPKETIMRGRSIRPGETDRGTLHCSGPVHPGGVYSAFAHIYAFCD